MSAQKSDARHVNNLLHTLRGEQFRHAQNTRGSRTHLAASSLQILNKPTLPFGLASLDYDTFQKIDSKKTEEVQSASSPKYSGPGPPKSWTICTDIRETASWRAQALSLLYCELDVSIIDERPIPLTMMCLLSVMSKCTLPELRKDILPFVPHHLRRELVRYTAIYSPLSNARLLSLYEAEGHAAGEMIFIGPANVIRDDYFIRGSFANGQESRKAPNVEETWDSGDVSLQLLQTFAVVSSRLSTSTVLTLPPTINHLVLINIPTSILIHRLPQICPLLVLLDLSYNDWLEHPGKETLKSLDMVEWSRWGRLRILGFRSCYIPDGMLLKLNKGRWDDVIVVR